MVWIDLLNPTAEEDARVEKLLGVAIPTREEMVEIEVSSRLYSENDALYMTASLLVGGSGPMPQSAPVTFILAQGKLVTVRYAEPGVFRTFVEQAQKADSNLKNADSLFIALLEAIIDRTADILEKVGADIDAISTRDLSERSRQGIGDQGLQGHAAQARPQRRSELEGAREPGQHRPAGEFPERRMRRPASRPARADADHGGRHPLARRPRHLRHCDHAVSCSTRCSA